MRGTLKLAVGLAVGTARAFFLKSALSLDAARRPGRRSPLSKGGVPADRRAGGWAFTFLARDAVTVPDLKRHLSLLCETTPAPVFRHGPSAGWDAGAAGRLAALTLLVERFGAANIGPARAARL